MFRCYLMFNQSLQKSMFIFCDIFWKPFITFEGYHNSKKLLYITSTLIKHLIILYIVYKECEIFSFLIGIAQKGFYVMVLSIVAAFL